VGLDRAVAGFKEAGLGRMHSEHCGTLPFIIIIIVIIIITSVIAAGGLQDVSLLAYAAQEHSCVSGPGCATARAMHDACKSYMCHAWTWVHTMFSKH